MRVAIKYKGRVDRNLGKWVDQMAFLTVELGLVMRIALTGT
jgi:hypothetical protein